VGRLLDGRLFFSRPQCCPFLNRSYFNFFPPFVYFSPKELTLWIASLFFFFVPGFSCAGSFFGVPLRGLFEMAIGEKSDSLSTPLPTDPEGMRTRPFLPAQGRRPLHSREGNKWLDF